MQVVIRATNIDLTEAIERHIRQRIELALHRFAGAIRAVVVRLVDLNGPRGGVDMRCHVSVALAGAGSVIIDHRDADLYRGVDMAMDRLKQVVSRRIGARSPMHRR